MSKIIVIEEDSAMRMLISEWLTGEGHEVRSLPRHDPAPDDKVELVILDLPHPRAPGTGTTEAVQAVHAAYPHSSVIGISTRLGRSLGGSSDVAQTLGVNRLLAKPCTREELLGAVAATL